MNNPPTNEFIETHNEPDFIKISSGRFNVLECIGETLFGDTYLLSEKETGKLYVLKTQRDFEKATAVVNEAELLFGLSHPGLPIFEEVTPQDGEQYIIREYIDGVPLDKYIEQLPADTKLIISIMISLCDILEFLHSQPQPIIHRDIKPSNIIYNPRDNSVSLIDFGISRKYSKEAKSDTMYFGTKDFAPPEQYGFSQTDRRSDIYSLGVVLRYLLTGTTEREAKIEVKTLAKIAVKCTALAPEARYQTAAAVKKAFRNYKNRIRRRSLAAVAACAVMFCLVFAVIAAANLGTPSTPIPEPSTRESRINTETFALLRVGMSMDEVQETIGEPQTIMNLSDKDQIYMAWDGDDSTSITAIFQDDHATSFSISNSPSLPEYAYGPGGINMETFAFLSIGMSVDEVLEIITVPFTAATIWEALGEDALDMIWYLDDYTGSISVSFTGGYVSLLLQVGLESA